MAKISVVIPVYNKAAYIGNTLQSLIDQNFTDFEAIVVIDGSTDGSHSVIKKFSDPRIRSIDQKNLGLSAARNTGIANAQTELIALLDADDLWKKDHLTRVLQLSVTFPDAALYGTGYEECFKNGNCIKPGLSLTETPGKSVIIRDFFEANMQQPLVAPSSFAFRKEIVDEIGGFDPKITYAEDVDFYIRANLKLKMAYDPAITCSYTMDAENQITRSSKSDRVPPNFQSYIDSNPEHFSLKRYVNLKRYFLAIFYKVEGNKSLFLKIRKKIDPATLTAKQRYLLAAPRIIVIGLRFTKSLLLKSGKRVTTF